jgi:drug/metabolite transporter (DMT)-like permease
VARVSWPRNWHDWRNSLIAGILLHGLYLGGVFWSVKHGLPAGISALVAGLQPLATGLLAGPLLGERVSRRRWVGIGIGFLGAALVVAPKLGAGGVPPLALGICLLGMLSITFGTIWQKRTGSTLDLRVNAAIQYIGAAAVTLPLVLLTEEGHMDLTLPLLGAMAWAVLGLSIGAIGLLLFLIRQGAVVGVATLLYLVPPVAALMAFALFGETLSPIQLAGMALAAIGVAVASRN